MDLEARRRASQRSFFSLWPHATPRDGIIATLTPESPDRSLLNGVVYTDPEAVSSSLDELERMYTEAGVRAWTVWVWPQDRSLAMTLSARGHKLDAAPEAMAAPLDELDLVGPSLGSAVSMDEVVRVNEAAYGLSAGQLAPVGALPDDALYRVGMPGRAVVGLHEHDGDAWIFLVATHPDSRGQGLAQALMKQALREARDRGCVTTSLEATRLGRPVYDRLGYQALGPVEMWESRAS